MLQAERLCLHSALDALIASSFSQSADSVTNRQWYLVVLIKLFMTTLFYVSLKTCCLWMQWILQVLLCSLLLLPCLSAAKFLVFRLAAAFIQAGTMFNIWVWSPSQQCCPCCSQWWFSWVMEVVLHGIWTLVENPCWLECLPLHQFQWLQTLIPLLLRFLAEHSPGRILCSPSCLLHSVQGSCRLQVCIPIVSSHWHIGGVLTAQTQKGTGLVNRLTRIVWRDRCLSPKIWELVTVFGDSEIRLRSVCGKADITRVSPASWSL